MINNNSNNNNIKIVQIIVLQFIPAYAKITLIKHKIIYVTLPTSLCMLMYSYTYQQAFLC